MHHRLRPCKQGLSGAIDGPSFRRPETGSAGFGRAHDEPSFRRLKPAEPVSVALSKGTST